MKTRLQQAFFNSSQGPQHREIGFPISTDNASWGVGPNTENFEKNSTGNASWGVGPNTENFEKNSTGNASWGVGANTEAYEKSAYNNVQVGGAPTKRNWIPNFYRQCELGRDNEINFVKISFLSHSHKVISLI
ncbi:TPA: hypothetical protein ACHCO4_002178 [Staphylococcus aureus]|uniref:hypothetical protein n=1 Tax=Staphylococcus aureus TaxID=1280 RepID=UPI001EFAE9A8|nr:hypothetical protein [Staphylococcus aureus]